MKFVSVSELEHFQFHDAEIKDIQLMDNAMTWKVSAINAMTSNSLNNKPMDMCIEFAVMVFQDVFIEKLEFSTYQVYNFDGKLIKSVEAAVANENDHTDILRESISSYCYIYGMDELLKIDDERYRVCFTIDGGAGNYSLTFTFSKAVVEWDEYSGEAWYEYPKWKQNKS